MTNEPQSTPDATALVRFAYVPVGATFRIGTHGTIDFVKTDEDHATADDVEHEITLGLKCKLAPSVGKQAAPDDSTIIACLVSYTADDWKMFFAKFDSEHTRERLEDICDDMDEARGMSPVLDAITDAITAAEPNGKQAAPEPTSPYYGNSECGLCNAKLHGKEAFAIPSRGTTPGKMIVCKSCAHPAEPNGKQEDAATPLAGEKWRENEAQLIGRESPTEPQVGEEAIAMIARLHAAECQLLASQAELVALREQLATAEAGWTKQSCLHAVTKFELKELREQVGKAVENMPALIEAAWREEERCASGALRYSRTDYACQNLGREILSLLKGEK